MEELIPDLESEGLSSGNIETAAQETEQKAILGEDPDSSEAIEFLCLAEGGEVLNAMIKGVKNRKLASKVLAEEKRHLQLLPD